MCFTGAKLCCTHRRWQLCDFKFFINYWQQIQQCTRRSYGPWVRHADAKSQAFSSYPKIQIHSLINHRTFPRALRQSPVKVLSLGSGKKMKGKACLTHLCELTEDASPNTLSPQCLVSPSPLPHGMELVLVDVLNSSAWLSWSSFLVKVEHFLPTYPGALKVSKKLELSVCRHQRKQAEPI